MGLTNIEPDKARTNCVILAVADMVAKSPGVCWRDLDHAFAVLEERGMIHCRPSSEGSPASPWFPGPAKRVDDAEPRRLEGRGGWRFDSNGDIRFDDFDDEE